MSDADCPCGCGLDLDDPTARAHAAWAYTRAAPTGRIRPDNRIAPVETALRIQAVSSSATRADYKAWTEAHHHVGVLIRMRASDESVTVAEARAALLWAERVGDDTL